MAGEDGVDQRRARAWHVADADRRRASIVAGRHVPQPAGGGKAAQFHQIGPRPVGVIGPMREPVGLDAEMDGPPRLAEVRIDLGEPEADELLRLLRKHAAGIKIEHLPDDGRFGSEPAVLRQAVKRLGIVRLEFDGLGEAVASALDVAVRGEDRRKVVPNRGDVGGEFHGPAHLRDALLDIGTELPIGHGVAAQR